MANYLANTLPGNYTISFASVRWGNLGHVMVVVAVDGVVVVVDPQTGMITTPVPSLAAAQPQVSQIVATRYANTSPVTVVAFQNMEGDVCPFFLVDPKLVTEFAARVITLTGNNPELYLMTGVDP